MLKTPFFMTDGPGAPLGSTFMDKNLLQPTGGHFPWLQGLVVSDGTGHITAMPLFLSNNPGPAADPPQGLIPHPALVSPLLAHQQSPGLAPQQLGSTHGMVTCAQAVSLSLDVISSDLKSLGICS